MGGPTALTAGRFTPMLAVVKTWLAIAGILIAALPATADTNLLNSSDWVVVGADDSGPSPQPINVVVDGLPVGSFTELNVFYNFEGTNLQQVFSLKGAGTIQPMLPPPLVPGGAMQLTSYRDCDEGLMPPVAITDLAFQTLQNPNSPLRASGWLSNFDSLQSTDLQMRFNPPRTNEVAVDIRYKLTATREICVDKTLDTEQDELRVAQMVANYISPEVCQNSRIRYTRIEDKICDGFGNCSATKESFCADLDNLSGYLYGDPRHLAESTVAFVHTNTLPQNTPTLAIDFRSPRRRWIWPQAYVVPTQDPAEANVTVWGNWDGIEKSYKSGKKVVRVRVLLIARDPKKPSCDHVKAHE
jgi:hypothetical protein